MGGQATRKRITRGKGTSELDVRPEPLFTVFEQVEWTRHASILALDEDLFPAVRLVLYLLDVNRIRSLQTRGGNFLESRQIVFLVVLLNVVIVAGIFVAVGLDPRVVLARIDQLEAKIA